MDDIKYKNCGGKAIKAEGQSSSKIADKDATGINPWYVYVVIGTVLIILCIVFK